MGTRKAAVFPEPVWAQDMRSLLARMMGIECFWTGVGFVYLASSMFPFITAVRFSCKEILEQIEIDLNRDYSHPLEVFDRWRHVGAGGLHGDVVVRLEVNALG